MSVGKIRMLDRLVSTHCKKYLDAILSREEYGSDDGRDAAKGDGLFLFPELPQDPGEVVVDDRLLAHPEGGQVLGGAEAAGDDDGGEVVDDEILEKRNNQNR
jgi:hypothetical protein